MLQTVGGLRERKNNVKTHLSSCFIFYGGEKKLKASPRLVGFSKTSVVDREACKDVVRLKLFITAVF